MIASSATPMRQDYRQRAGFRERGAITDGLPVGCPAARDPVAASAKAGGPFRYGSRRRIGLMSTRRYGRGKRFRWDSRSSVPTWVTLAARVAAEARTVLRGRGADQRGRGRDPV